MEGDYGEFVRLLERLKDFVVIVEGKKDRAALKTLGLYNVIAINGRPLIKVVDEVRGLGNAPVILTDFDSKGMEIARKLNSLFQAFRIHPNSGLRCRLMGFGKNRIEDFGNVCLEAGMGIQGLWTEAGTSKMKESDLHVKASSYFNKVRDKGAHKDKGSSGKAGRNRCYFWPD